MATSSGGDTKEILSVYLQLLTGELDSVALSACLHTLQKILSNVTKSSDKKFRHMKKDNKTFHCKVWQYEAAHQFLLATGWAQDESCVYLLPDNNVELALSLVNHYISLHCPPEVTSPAHSSRNMAGPSWSSDERSEKEKLIAEERKKMLAQLKREKEEKRRISEQIKKDRQDTNTREVKDSHAQHLHGGGKMTKFEDIGVNLNKGGG